MASVPTAKPPGDGWQLWMMGYRFSKGSPYDHDEIEVWREGWDQPRRQSPYGGNPHENVADLYWRPAPTPPPKGE